MDKDNQYGVFEQQKKLLEFFKCFHSFCIKNDINESKEMFLPRNNCHIMIMIKAVMKQILCLKAVQSD